jgi:aminoglycoside/choline kinase family phosphotransferase
MKDIPVATNPEQLEQAWLASVLAGSGVIESPQQMIAFRYEEIGTGQMSNSFRLFLELKSDDEKPSTVVVKLPSHDEGSRAAGSSLQIYAVEVNFYKVFSAQLPIRTPRCYYADIADNGVDFVLLLEDLSPAEQGDQLMGCTVEQARLAVLEAAKLHVPHMDDPMLETLDWLNRDSGEMDMTQLVPALYPEFRKRYEGAIDNSILDMGERFMAAVSSYYEKPRPYTLVHTDYRLDNMLFGSAAGGPPVAVVDWQTVSLGNPMGDIAYFIGAGLTKTDRRQHEESLVKEYYDTLVREGVQNYSWEECWQHYRLYAFAGFHMAVMASMLVERTERGDEMFRVMAERHGHQILDLASEELLV